MATRVLTTASVVTCPHAFAITFTSAASVRVAGSPVVRQPDIAGAVIACTAQQKCTVIQSFQTSATLRDGTTPVVLAAGLATNFGACTVNDVAHDLLRTD